MKHPLLLTSVAALLGTTGCIFPGHRGGGDYGRHDEHGGHGEYREHQEFRSYPEPAVEVRIHE